MRAFALTLDVRTFQAGTRLPLNLAKTYIQAVLPADVLGKSRPGGSMESEREMRMRKARAAPFPLCTYSSPMSQSTSVPHQHCPAL